MSEPDTKTERATRYRQEARQIRERAARRSNAEEIAELIRISEAYERLADRLEGKQSVS